MLIVCYKTYEKINTFSSPPSELSPLLSSVYTFFVYLFIHSLFVCLFFFSHRVPSNLFQKLLIHIFEKRKNLELQLGYLLEPGRLLSFHRN